MLDDKLTDQLEAERQLVELLLVELAEARRERKAKEFDRDGATADARTLLAELEEPFARALEALGAREQKALDAAVEEITKYDAARKIQLIAGIETPQPARPSGVTIKWLETPTVPDAAALPAAYRVESANMKAIKAAIAGGAEVAGVEILRKPSITVGAE